MNDMKSRASAFLQRLTALEKAYDLVIVETNFELMDGFDEGEYVALKTNDQSTITALWEEHK